MSTHSPPTDASTDPDQPFEATIRAGPLQAAIDAVGALVEECVVRATPEGLAVDAQDPATVAMVSLELPAAAFEQYAADGARLGVDLERLGDVVGMADRDEPVRLGLAAETRTLHVRVGELSYTLALIDPDAIRAPPEEIDLDDRYAATVGVDGDAVAHLVGAAGMVSDHVELAAGEGGFRASADGDTDSVTVEHPGKECDPFEVAGGPVDSLFSVSYLAAFAGVVPPDAAVTLRFGDGQPVEFTFDLAGGSARYVVAPRISR